MRLVGNLNKYFSFYNLMILPCCFDGRQHMKENLAELRESNSSLEHSRGAGERHLASKEMELEKARSTMNEMEREICMMKDRCNGLVHINSF